MTDRREVFPIKNSGNETDPIEFLFSELFVDSEKDVLLYEYLAAYAEPSATPLAGAVSWEYRMDGFDTWVPLPDSTIDMLAPDTVVVTQIGIDALRLVQDGNLDAGKTVNARVWIKDR